MATFLHEYTYIRALTFEIPELLVYVAIGFLFRLRNFEPFEQIELGKFNLLIFIVSLTENKLFLTYLFSELRRMQFLVVFYPLVARQHVLWTLLGIKFNGKC